MLLSRKNESTGKNLLMMTCDANVETKQTHMKGYACREALHQQECTHGT